MAWRLKLVPEKTNWDFFRFARYTFGASLLGILISFVSIGVLGFNFGIDFLGGTTIRTQSTQPIDLAAYREAVEALDLGDVTLTEVFDPSFAATQHVAQLRIQAQADGALLSAAQIASVEAALKMVDPSVSFQAVETVGPKVSGELIQTAIVSLVLALVGVMIYVWLRFEWQFGVAAVVSLAHDAILTVGVFSLFQMRFDLTVVAAVLTIVGYSINDTVVIFDRVRENLIKYKKRSLKDVVNLSLNETLSRTVMTSSVTMLALIALYVFGGDVIRGFSFAMIFGVLVGVYSTIFVASVTLIWLGVNRERVEKTDSGKGDTAGTPFQS